MKARTVSDAVCEAEPRMPHDIAVIMAAYNAEVTIGRAVDSLMRNAEPFDLLIVDDASPHPVAEALGPLPPNVEILRLEKNLGVVAARNAGLRKLLAKDYVFIAVLDADDVSRPDRLAKQAAFLKSRPEIALVGSWARYLDEETREVVLPYRPPCDPESIRSALYVNNCTVHSSWMLRAQVLRRAGIYSENYPFGEDYELLRRMATQFDVANLPEYLVDYTISMAGLSMRKRRRQLFDRLRVQLHYFDPWRLRAWFGVLRTLALFAVPLKVIAAYRAERGLRLAHS
jgi:glycosyltransferase involved in cell wall biosynthesis